jgi:hypothetical protein
MRISSKIIRINKESIIDSMKNVYFPGFEEMQTHPSDYLQR